MSESKLSRVDFEVARKLLQEEMKAGKYRPIIEYCEPRIFTESWDRWGKVILAMEEKRENIYQNLLADIDDDVVKLRIMEILAERRNDWDYA